MIRMQLGSAWVCNDAVGAWALLTLTGEPPIENPGGSTCGPPTGEVLNLGVGLKHKDWLKTIHFKIQLNTHKQI